MSEELPAITVLGERRVLRFTYGSARRLADATGVNILAAPSDNGMALLQVRIDPELLTKVVWTMLALPEERRQEFDDALDADALYAMQEAFEAAVLDFFRHSPANQDRIRAGIEFAEEVQERTMASARAKIPGRLDSLIDEAFAKSDSTSPANSASTPTTTRLET